MPATDSYGVEHLILLVGGNPLPNAVAGALLAKPGGRITLVHSEGPAGTGRVAERLCQWLRQRGRSLAPELVGVDEASPLSIRNAVRSTLRRGESVGLNYTGGTKAMAVHSYRTLEEWVNTEGSGIAPVYSYLDARRLKIVFDQGAAPGPPPAQYVGLVVKVTLQELLDLHGLPLRNGKVPTADPVLPRTAQALREALAQEEAGRAWRNWLKTELWQKALRLAPVANSCPHAPGEGPCTVERPLEPRKWKARGALGGVTLNFPTDPVLAKASSCLKEELSQTEAINLGAAARSCGYREPEDFCKWLDGMWLESSVLQALRELPPALRLHDMRMNVKPDFGDDPSRDPELDVVACCDLRR